MPKKTQEPVIVARCGDKVAGWIGAATGGRFYGDPAWVQAAKDAATAGLEFTLYENLDFVAGDDTVAGAFAALAWYAKERIRVIESPDGFMESIGLLDDPEEIDVLDDEELDPEEAEDEKRFRETHVRVIVDGVLQWIPLVTLTEKPSGLDATLVRIVLERLEAERRDSENGAE